MAELEAIYQHNESTTSAQTSSHSLMRNLRDTLTTLFWEANKRIAALKSRSNNVQDPPVLPLARASSDNTDQENHRYLLLCLSQWKHDYLRTKLIRIQLLYKSDEELFKCLRTECLEMIRWWQSILSLKRLKDIRFVKVCSKQALCVIEVRLKSVSVSSFGERNH
jgi:hypothetical protein